MQQARADGAMAAIEAAETDVLDLLVPWRERGAAVDIAAVKGPPATVISGDADAVDAIAERAAERGLWTRRLHVSHAFHSAHMDGAPAEFGRIAGALRFAPPTVASRR